MQLTWWTEGESEILRIIGARSSSWGISRVRLTGNDSVAESEQSIARWCQTTCWVSYLGYSCSLTSMDWPSSFPGALDTKSHVTFAPLGTPLHQVPNLIFWFVLVARCDASRLLCFFAFRLRACLFHVSLRHRHCVVRVNLLKRNLPLSFLRFHQHLGPRCVANTKIFVDLRCRPGSRPCTRRSTQLLICWSCGPQVHRSHYHWLAYTIQIFAW